MVLLLVFLAFLDRLAKTLTSLLPGGIFVVLAFTRSLNVLIFVRDHTILTITSIYVMGMMVVCVRLVLARIKSGFNWIWLHK